MRIVQDSARAKVILTFLRDVTLLLRCVLDEFKWNRIHIAEGEGLGGVEKLHAYDQQARLWKDPCSRKAELWIS